MLNKKSFIVISIITVVVLVGGYYFAKRTGYIPNTGKSDIVQPTVGGDRDAHGCIGSAGYSWCEAKQKCLRPWEEKCETATSKSFNGKKNIGENCKINSDCMAGLECYQASVGIGVGKCVEECSLGYQRFDEKTCILGT